LICIWQAHVLPVLPGLHYCVLAERQRRKPASLHGVTSDGDIRQWHWGPRWLAEPRCVRWSSMYLQMRRQCSPRRAKSLIVLLLQRVSERSCAQDRFNQVPRRRSWMARETLVKPSVRWQGHSRPRCNSSAGCGWSTGFDLYFVSLRMNQHLCGRIGADSRSILTLDDLPSGTA
jgi:hypothetical protein